MSPRGRKKQVKINPIVIEIIQDYIIEVYQKWNSNVFPSSQLTKVVLARLEKPKSYYRIYHQMIKQILRKWEKQEICSYVETESEITQKSRKMFYQFSDNSIRGMQLEQIIPLPL